MAVINVLDRQVAELIAAGEVVERPASVIKELVENSIDSGASAITVEIKNGGVTYMRVGDDGCGMAAEDVPRAFLRHATSKVRTKEDLDGILTLGFRGEALCSVAAVARVKIFTCQRGAIEGTEYAIAGGIGGEIEPSGCPEGTTITVSDLFYNVPARQKFLKKDASEGAAVAAVVDRLALSHPEVAFKFIRDGKQAMNTAGDGKLESAVLSVLGRDFLEGLLPVDYTCDGVRVSGFVTAPAAGRPNRNGQYFFLNKRYMKSTTFTAAVDESFKKSHMTGRYAGCVLHIDLAADSVDINVHPSKTQVRFDNDRPVFSAVYYAVRTALTKGDSTGELHIDEEPAVSAAVPMAPAPLAPAQSVFSAGQAMDTFVPANSPPTRYTQPPKAFPVDVYVDDGKKTGVGLDVNPEAVFGGASGTLSAGMFQESAPFYERSMPVVPLAVPSPGTTDTNRADIAVPCEPAAQDYLLAADESDPVPLPPVPLPPVPRLIGEGFSTYIIAEYENDIWIIDKHAAHERMIYEQIKDRPMESQMLLSPQTVRLPHEEYAALLENAGELNEAGFCIEDFGMSSVIVQAVPAPLCGQDIKSMLDEIAGNLLGGTKGSTKKAEWLYHSIACRAAIKAGDKSSPAELLALLKQIAPFKEDGVRYCPHGRPVAYRLSRAQLDKQFGRI